MKNLIPLQKFIINKKANKKIKLLNIDKKENQQPKKCNLYCYFNPKDSDKININKNKEGKPFLILGNTKK